MLAHLGQGLAPAAGGDHPVALALQDLRQQLQDHLVVVDGQHRVGLLDRRGARRGRRGLRGLRREGRARQGLEDGPLALLERRQRHRRRLGGGLRGRRGRGRGHRVGGHLLHVRDDRAAAGLERPARLDHRVLDAGLQGDHGREPHAALELDLGHEHVVRGVGHGQLQPGGLDLHGEDEVALAQVQADHVQQAQVDLVLGEVHRRHAQLAAEVGDRELLGEDALAHENARQALAVGALQGQGLLELGFGDEVGLQQDLAQFLLRLRHVLSLPLAPPFGRFLRNGSRRECGGCGAGPWAARCAAGPRTSGR